MVAVGFTGTRERLTSRQDSTLIAWFILRERGVFHHGDCVGADAAAHAAALYHGWRIEAHPGLGPINLRAFCTGYSRLHPAKPNLERNADIVNAATELLACPNGPEVVRSGTWSTVRKARSRGLTITIIWPDGSVTNEAASAAHAAQVVQPIREEPQPPPNTRREPR